MTAGLIIGVLVFAAWNWVVRATVLSYGAAGSIYFTPAAAYPGDNVQMHFDDVTWYRSCPSKLFMYFYPARGARIDLPVHEVSYPKETGKLPPKWRPFKVPDTSQYGKGIVTGHLSSSCWPFEGFPIITSLPDVPLEIVRR